jgi:triacylglycerol esterase/lipase EstA (alpha/beta hydrolase family)
LVGKPLSLWFTLVPLFVFAVSASVALVGFFVQAADRNVPFTADRRTVGMIAREAGARIVLTVMDLAFWPLPDAAPAAAGERRVPVLVVPGMNWSSGSLWPLATFLRQRGFSVWATARTNRRAPLAVEAAVLARRIDEWCARTGRTQVDLVAFSTGGLVAAWYLRNLGAGHPRVRRLVTVATPWKGTRMAVFGRGPAVDEIRWGSHVLDGLFPPPVPTTCVYSPDDPMVVPAGSAAPDPGSNLVPIDSVQIDSGGHLDLLVSARVFRAVMTALDAPGGTTGEIRLPDAPLSTGPSPGPSGGSAAGGGA